MEIEGSVTGLLEMAGQGASTPAAKLGVNPEQPGRSTKDGVIDLTNQDGVWVEQAEGQSEGKPAPHGRPANSLGAAAKQFLYDWRGKPVSMQRTFAGSLLSVYA